MFGKNWKQYTPFFFYPAASIIFCLCAAINKSPSARSLFLLICAGFLSWGFVEYALHRFIFHYEARSARSRELLYRMHFSHHENPRSRDRLFVNLGFSLPIAVLYCLSAYFLLGDWHRTAYIFAGLVAGYLCYEVLHYRAHHCAARLPLFRYLKRYHLLHHYKTPEQRFGVTSPLFDYLFGTSGKR